MSSFDQLLSKLSTRLINSQGSETSQCVSEVIAAYGDYCQADRCYIFEFNEDITSMSNTVEWVREGFTRHIDDLQNVGHDDLPYFFATMRNDFRFVCPDVSRLPDSAKAERDEFEREQIKSVLCIGLVAKGRLLGFVGCDKVRQKYHWTEEDIQHLSLIADMIANTIERERTHAALLETKRALELANQQLTQQANIDGLTGVANRRALDERLATEIRRAKRQQTGIAMLLLDIDDFKAYNDHFGHLAGDDALKAVSQSLAQLVKRGTDFVARYGGEEFAILMSSANASSVLKMANNISEQISRLAITHPKSQCADILTVSIGGYYEPPIADSELVKTSKRLIKNADTALYRAKLAGRNCIRFY